MLVEILRVRREQPDVPPERYTEVDERFRKFVDCDLGRWPVGFANTGASTRHTGTTTRRDTELGVVRLAAWHVTPCPTACGTPGCTHLRRGWCLHGMKRLHGHGAVTE